VSKSGVGRTVVAGVAVLLILLAAALPLAACGANDDPFTGLWWEPASGRRIEITKDGGRYSFLYGAARRPYQAAREGDALRIRQPIGDDIVVKLAADGRLEMLIGGKSSRLVRVPQHQ
jgi:hypothetical protein